MSRSIAIVLTLLSVAPAYADSNCAGLSGIGAAVESHVIAGRSECCLRMKATDTLTLKGHRQHAERFVECIVGHWPNVDSVFRESHK